MALTPLSARFQSLPLLPTIKLGPSDAGSRVDGLVHALGPSGSLQWPLLWGWEFLLLPPQPPWVFSIRGLRLYFPVLEAWVVQSALLPRCSSGLSMHECGATGSASGRTACPVCSTICHLSGSSCVARSPLHPGCLFLPLLPVWMNVSSLSPWLLDFRAVWFSVSSGCFLFLNCCPSFGCARRHSVSTYASILAGSL